MQREIASHGFSPMMQRDAIFISRFATRETQETKIKLRRMNSLFCEQQSDRRPI